MVGHDGSFGVVVFLSKRHFSHKNNKNQKPWPSHKHVPKNGFEIVLDGFGGGGGNMMDPVTFIFNLSFPVVASPTNVKN